jgi:hypothetical protein
MTPQKRKQGKTQSGKRKAVKTNQTKNVDVLVDELFDRAGMDLIKKTFDIAYSCSKMPKSTWMAMEWCSMLH